MKKIYALMLLVVVQVLVWGSFASAELKWLSLKEGMEKATIDKKPLIVDFYFGKGCPRCEQLQKAVYNNDAIAKKIVDDFIPVRVDLTKKLSAEEEDLGKRYDFKNDCLLLFLDWKGNIVKDPSGKRLCFTENVEPEWFVRYLDTVKQQMK